MILSVLNAIYLCNYVRCLKKIQDFNGIWTCHLAISVRRSQVVKPFLSENACIFNFFAILTWFLILGKIHPRRRPRWRSLLVTSQGSSSATTYKLYFILREDQRLSTKGKIVSKYCNISETPRRDSINPLPLYHGGGMNLLVRPIFNKYESAFHGFPVLLLY